MTPVLIVLLPFLGAVLPALLIGAGRRVCALSAAAVTLTALVGLLTHLPAVAAGDVVTAGGDWLPEIGLEARFFIDPLGFFFATLILGIGLLVIIYARGYLSREDPMGAFYAYLLLFQGAMVGIVLSDNILFLLIFWELTSLSSFLLIGYWKHLPEGRQGARMALAVTGGGGLALIAGMLLLGEAAGTYQISELLTRRDEIQASPLYLPALILILLGCFTKSAQFPFHFWLPHAMAAPTPVSAYLHSATMVKAGLFLMARLWPVLSGTEAWFYIVATTGIVTMLLAAIIALFKDDLKALLAFSTVSHLGLITFLLGIGNGHAVTAAVFHILNHAAFKAALFMTAGIVDHEAGTRQLPRLGGLRTLMPVTFVIGTVAALAMAGVPFFNGFISKEMMLDEAVHTSWAGIPWLLPLLAGIGALFSAAYSFRLVGHTFLGPVRDDYPHRPHDPNAWMWLPPALLALIALLVGIFPQLLAGGIVESVSKAVAGMAYEIDHVELKIWHGVTPALIISAVALTGGLLLVLIYGGAAAVWRVLPVPYAKDLFDAVIGALVSAARWISDLLHNGSLSRYAAVFTVTTLALAVHAGVTASNGIAGGIHAPVIAVPAAAWVVLAAACVALAAWHRRRFLALVLVGVIGLIVSVTFVYFSAPDLALTQILVEVVTVILLLLALNFLPKRGPVETRPARRIRDLAIAVPGGLGVAFLTYAILMSDFAAPTISDYYLENSVPQGGGHNIVNVILVDFRGFDTFGEIIVLGIAALVIFAATEALLTGPAAERLRTWTPDYPRAGDAHPMMMVVNTRVMMPAILMVAVYLFLRGHNQPGGGFIAGLVAAIALVMQYMASGFAWADARQRFPYHGVVGFGVLVAGLTGIAAWFFGRPFLTSTFTYVHIPGIEEFEIASAAAFDLGVFLAVVGAVMLSLESFSRIARRSNDTISDEPMDIDPSKGEGVGDPA